MGSFNGNLILISGGQDNEQDYRDYAETVENNERVKAVITLYQTGPKIAGVCGSLSAGRDLKTLRPKRWKKRYKRLLTS